MHDEPDHGTALRPLGDLRVIDLSMGIAGGYATKLLADAGADVIKVEPPDGDPLRRWSVSRQDLAGADGALFRFLSASKRSMVGQASDPAVLELLATADVVVDAPPSEALEALDVATRFPHLVRLSLSAFGTTGPWRDHPWTEFTVQAASGSTAGRGFPEGTPVAIGGRLSEWATGLYGAPATLAAVRHARRTGRGSHIDVSMLECSTILTTLYADLFFSLLGRPPLTTPARMVELPSIEPTADGWVGFAILSAQQYADFCVLIERPELADDPQLQMLPGRLGRRAEWNEAVRDWTRRHTTAEVLERAALLRVPAAPVCNGATVLAEEQLTARGFFAEGEGGVRSPRPPYLIDGRRLPPAGPPPRLGAHRPGIGWQTPRPSPPTSDADAAALPLAGVKIVELTSYLAGPAAGHYFAALGAEVIHVESIQRIDGFRTVLPPGFGALEEWWERGPAFLAVNTNKKSVTLDLSSARGIAVMRRLIGWADVLIENYSPRVMEGFGLDWPAVHDINPKLTMVRMPAFGLTGPWRDRGGFAQTAEQISGMAWVTGCAEPLTPRGPGDHIAGIHAAFAALVGLTATESIGRGCLVEVPLVECALNVTAEQVLEHTAYGVTLGRYGNRAPDAAPQGLYRCRGAEQWVALSIADDAQWAAFRELLGNPAWAMEAKLDAAAGRQAEHDRLDVEIGGWVADRDLTATVGELLARGIPAAAVTDPRAVHANPQNAARGFLETVEHPVVGSHPLFTLPLRMTGIDRWIRSPAPTLGQHNAEVLCDRLQLSRDELRELEEDGVIGNRPLGL